MVLVLGFHDADIEFYDVENRYDLEFFECTEEPLLFNRDVYQTFNPMWF
jgi:hypothetical protein